MRTYGLGLPLDIIRSRNVLCMGKQRSTNDQAGLMSWSRHATEELAPTGEVIDWPVRGQPHHQIPSAIAFASSSACKNTDCVRTRLSQ